MTANQPLWPQRWLMTDERLGDRLWRAVDRLPHGAGIILRHYSLGHADRLAHGLRLAERARERGLLLGVAGSRSLASELGAALIHNPDRPGDLPFSLAVHDEAEARIAAEAGATLAFVAPVFPTRSHPDRAALGIGRAAELAAMAGCPAIALGGVDESRFAALRERGFHGYAGIDCWLI